LRALALEKGVIAAARSRRRIPGASDKGFPMIVNLNEARDAFRKACLSLGEVPAKISRNHKKISEGCHPRQQFTTTTNRKRSNWLYSRLERGTRCGQPRLRSVQPGYAADLSVAQDGIQIMLDEDIRAGVVEKNLPGPGD
jgi:hypothetical protein